MLNRLLRLALFAVAVALPQPATAQASARLLAPDTSWVGRSALYEVFVRDFSPAGTFRGVIEGLDRIQSSGADVIWLMPIHPIGVRERKGSLGSPYAVRDYRAVNPEYGDTADFRALVQAAHAKGLKVILDWVANHTAADHRWIKEHPGWYVLNERGEPSVPRDEQGKLTDWTDVAQLDYRKPEVRREMIASMRWWLEQFDVDGFRMDVAGYLPPQFWREALSELRRARPRPILLLAESEAYEMHRVGFDLTYGWEAYNRLKAIWNGASAATFVRDELADLRALPTGGKRMRFTTNHDETAWDAPPLTLFGGSAGARAAFAAIALLPGRPLLYNGQEVESPQQLGLFEREAVAWNQNGAADARAFYKAVVTLTRTEPGLLSMDLRPVQTSAPDDVIAYRRGDLMVLVNARPRALRLAIQGPSVAGARDLLLNRPIGGDSIQLPAYGAAVFRAPR